jgi:hypothetical protein
VNRDVHPENDANPTASEAPSIAPTGNGSKIGPL